MLTKLKVRSDGGDFGSKKFKLGYKNMVALLVGSGGTCVWS
jgi:hypothetical protein